MGKYENYRIISRCPGEMPSSLSDLKNRGENSAGREQILPVLQVNSHSIDQKSGEIWAGQADLQPISFKSDRLLEGWDEGMIVAWAQRRAHPAKLRD